MNKEELASLQLISVRWWNATAYYAISLAKILQDAGYPVTVGGTAGSPPIKAAGDCALETFHDIHLESFQPFRMLRNYTELKNFITRNGIRLINAHRPEDHLFSGLLNRRRGNIRLVRTVGDVRAPKNNPVNKWLHLEATDFFIFSCRANMQRYLDVWPIPQEKTAVIYAPVDTEYFTPPADTSSLRRKLNISEEKIVFGVVGRFSPVKDHETFLQAAARVSQKLADVEFIISGEEVEISRQQLMDRAKKLGLEKRVHFLDKQEDVREVISASDVGVTCSNGSEAVSRISAEFMAMGRPILVSDVNVLPEMITHGVEGFVFSSGSPQQLAGKMEKLLNDPASIKAMGQKARKNAVTNFSHRKFLTDTLSVYEKVLAKRGI
ncbi:MAG: glycosyltransferase family 4 protein [Calditrichia bacterium]